VAVEVVADEIVDEIVDEAAVMYIIYLLNQKNMFWSNIGSYTDITIIITTMILMDTLSEISLQKSWSGH